MSTVLEIEDAVAKLAEPEFQTFAAWFDQTRASSVDDAFESAIRYHKAGKTIALNKSLRRQ